MSAALTCARRHTDMDFQDSLQHTLLDRDEERQLLELAVQGNADAENRLVRMNQRLVYKIARRYYLSGMCGDQELADVMQWGNLGLLEAIRRWDIQRTVRFSTYATHWIRSYVRRFGILRGISFSVSFGLSEKLSTVRGARSRLTNTTCQEPTPSEIANQVDMSVEDVKFALTMHPISLDTTPRFDDGDNPGLHDAIGAEDDYTRLDREYLHSQVEKLPKSDREIIQHRYGLINQTPKTYREISLIYGISMTRIQQIEARALSRLRANLNSYE